jgi:hypothetical protein
MRKHEVQVLEFETQNIPNLAEALTRGLVALSYDVLPVADYVTLVRLHARESTLEVTSIAHDVGASEEVGVLRFKELISSERAERYVPLGDEFRTVIDGTKLVASVNGVLASSGIVLRARGSKAIVIVAGVGPYTVALRAPGVTIEFQPERDLEDFKDVPLT